LGRRPLVTLADVKLPRNIKRGQLRKIAGLVDEERWKKLDEEGRDALDALSLLIYLRVIHKDDHEPFGDEKNCLPLSNDCMRALLRALGARKKGERAARLAINRLKQGGAIVDTGKVLKPKRQPQVSIKEERAARRRDFLEGKTRSVLPQEHSYWWRVFRVPALTRITRSVFPQGTYGSFLPVPTALVSLSAFLRRQGLLKVPERRKNAEYGSVQCAFHNTGPP
jgi:hypothetical protein